MDYLSLRASAYFLARPGDLPHHRPDNHQLPLGAKADCSFASTRLDRCIVGLLIGGIIMCGWTKGPVPIGNTVAQFVTSLYSGGIVDVSGLVAASTEAETVAAFAELSGGAITEAASATITDAQAEIDDVAFFDHQRHAQGCHAVLAAAY